ncbi:hypothetical protein [Candidatus Solirubrobacter pratensis]|uniref:hypothetical protein n=1 Tax=Candidatus Solirubrobacter pratensis TaxID=1298857 RepID=UPI0012DE6E9F|nr:hypothetical protein [Candidatus Solirubrobacter pratensis]
MPPILNARGLQDLVTAVNRSQRPWGYGEGFCASVAQCLKTRMTSTKPARSHTSVRTAFAASGCSGIASSAADARLTSASVIRERAEQSLAIQRTAARW